MQNLEFSPFFFFWSYSRTRGEGGLGGALPHGSNSRPSAKQICWCSCTTALQALLPHFFFVNRIFSLKKIKYGFDASNFFCPGGGGVWGFDTSGHHYSAFFISFFVLTLLSLLKWALFSGTRGISDIVP